MNLPTEILSKIFDYVSIPRYKAACSLTCKGWHLAAQPSLYYKVQLYTSNQFFLFLFQVYDAGELVKHLELDYSLLYMKQDTWYQLQKLCPNVVHFNYINNR